jgi:hypothetical protein
MLRRTAFAFSLVLSAYSLAAAQSAPITVNPGKSADTSTLKPPPPQQPSTGPQLKPADLDSRQSLNDGTKMQLIRIMDAEFAHVRKYFPVGDKSLVIGPDGAIKPGDDTLFRMAQSYGAAAKIGDRVQITNIVFREKSIYLEINGGPKKKQKWYQHIQISGMGGAVGGTDPNQAQPTGAAMTLQFNKHVPEMTGAELKQLLSPVLDFSVKTAAEVYVDTLPPKIKAAVKNHEVLVGMNREMVVMAKDRPPQKVREKDEKGREYEEWIYGKQPQDVVFVRFIGDEVTQVKIAKVGGEMIVKTQKEVEVKDGVPTLAALKASDHPEEVKGGPEPEPQHTKAPTLKRPDEQPDPVVQRGGSGGAAGTPSSPSQDEPQWGTNGKQPDTSEQPADTQQKPDQQKPPLL